MKKENKSKRNGPMHDKQILSKDFPWRTIAWDGNQKLNKDFHKFWKNFEILKILKGRTGEFVEEERICRRPMKMH